MSVCKHCGCSCKTEIKKQDVSSQTAPSEWAISRPGRNFSQQIFEVSKDVIKPQQPTGDQGVSEQQLAPKFPERSPFRLQVKPHNHNKSWMYSTLHSSPRTRNISQVIKKEPLELSESYKQIYQNLQQSQLKISFQKLIQLEKQGLMDQFSINPQDSLELSGISADSPSENSFNFRF